MNKKVIVIGGGIAGLSAGIYAQKCGFDVTILESHFLPGGNCTSWKRGDYLFEGGMHWLTGSNPKEQVNSMWRCTGALTDDVEISYFEPFGVYDHNGTQIRLYRDVDKTEKHFLELSPEDEKEIKKFCNNIRKVKNLSMPVTDVKGVKVTKKSRPPLSMLTSAMSAISLIKSFAKVSREEYAKKFVHEGLQELIRAMTDDKTGIAPFIFTMGSLARGDGGFPEGGSLPFAKRMADMFTGLGGKIEYETRADRVIIENNKVAGVMIKKVKSFAEASDNERIDADAVIVTADTMAINHLFDSPPKAKWLDEMRSNAKPTMVTFISLGINADLSNYPHYGIFKLKDEIKLADQTYDYLSTNNYASDPVYSPQGKTAMTIQLSGDTYDFWKKAKEDGTYEEEKQKIADAVINAIAVKMPETDGKIEVCDVATPLTYERYCANWRGSWMTEMTPEMKIKTYPAIIDGLSGVYFAGHRMMPPGGLPTAIMTARIAIQHLCRETDTLFISED